MYQKRDSAYKRCSCCFLDKVYLPLNGHLIKTKFQLLLSTDINICRCTTTQRAYKICNFLRDRKETEDGKPIA